MDLYPFLTDAQIERVWNALEVRIPREVRRALGSETAYGNLAKRSILFSVFGFGILKETGARAALLSDAQHGVLVELAAAYGVSTNRKLADTVLILASQSWTRKSPLADFFRRQYEVPASFLPAGGNRTSPVSTLSPVEPLPTLFDYQLEISDAIVKSLASERSLPFLVQLPTGAGKTRTMVDGLIRALCDENTNVRSVLWLAHSQELCQQVDESFSRAWMTLGCHDIRIVRAWGGTNPMTDNLRDAFVISSFKKAALSQEKTSRLWMQIERDVDLLVVDEAHKSIAPTVASIVSSFRRRGRAVAGLTATPGRGIEALSENRALSKMYPRLIQGSTLGPNPIRTLQDRGVLARIKHEFVESKRDYGSRASFDEFDFSTRFLRQLEQDASRNRLIVDTIRRHVEKGRSTLVFACSVQHAQLLAAHCARVGAPSSYVHHAMPAVDRYGIIKHFARGGIKVICNFGVLTTGFDAPGTECIVITRPTSSIVLYSQMIGRGMRGPSVGGSSWCHVVDVRDNLESFGEVSEVYNYFSGYW